MEDRIKSAAEIAMEKAAKLSKLTPEETMDLKWVPEGERIAALYLRGEVDLAKALKTLDRVAFPSVLKGMVSILLPNLGIPKNDADAAANRRVTEALPILCRDKKALELILGQVAQVQRQHASYGKQLMEKSYQELRQRFMAQVQQKLEQRGVRPPSMQLDIDSMPEFQAQWRAMAARIEQQYEQHLARFREQLRELILAKPALL